MNKNNMEEFHEVNKLKMFFEEKLEKLFKDKKLLYIKYDMNYDMLIGVMEDLSVFTPFYLPRTGLQFDPDSDNNNKPTYIYMNFSYLKTFCKSINIDVMSIGIECKLYSNYISINITDLCNKYYISIEELYNNKKKGIT